MPQLICEAGLSVRKRCDAMNLDWLFATPIAHRGLHSHADGIVENTTTAAARAVARGFAIECDIQRTIDDEAVVFHDWRLERLTTATGVVADMTAADLARAVFHDTSDRIVPLREFLDAIGGVVPVIVEIKSAFDGDFRLADRAAAIVKNAPGKIAIKSFDPDVIAHLWGNATLEARGIPRGIVAERTYEDGEWQRLPAERRRELAEFLHFDRSRPDFLSYRARDLPCAVPYLCRTGLGLPIMTWTVRSAIEAEHARRWSDQIVFEGFDPG